jgi:hypothetical protein
MGNGAAAPHAACKDGTARNARRETFEYDLHCQSLSLNLLILCYKVARCSSDGSGVPVDLSTEMPAAVNVLAPQRIHIWNPCINC